MLPSHIPCEEYLEYLEKTLPVMCRMKHLVDVGLYTSDMSGVRARWRGRTPDSIEMENGQVCYPKASVIAYVKRLAKYGTFPKTKRPYTRGRSEYLNPKIRELCELQLQESLSQKNDTDTTSEAENSQATTPNPKPPNT